MVVEYQCASIPKELIIGLRKKLKSGFSSDSERIKHVIREFLKNEKD